MIRNSKILEEIHGHISNPIDLDLFSKFEAFNKKIEKLKIEIKKIYTKIIKTKGFLKTELEEKILIRFKKDLDSIEDLYYEKNQELDTCENDKKEFVTTIQNLWIIVNSDKGNRLNLAKEALMNGDLNGAERILNQEDIEIEYSKIIKIEDTINEEKERIAKEFLARANIVLTLKKEINWLEESIENLEKASKISVDSTTLFDVANLFMNLNFSTNAIICFNQSVKLDASNFIKGQIFNNLGIIYKSLGDFKNGESSHLNSIKIKKLLSEENPEKYLIYLANSYINLGVFYFHFSKEEEAKINYLLAMKELEELRLKYNAVYLPFFGQLFNNMGRLFHQVGKLTDAKSAYLESIRVLRAIPKEEIDNITNVQISNALVNLGNLHLNEKSFLIAYSHFSEAYSILESVFKDEPIRYSSNIGVCLIGLGNACFLNLEFDKAEDSLNEALGIFSRINRSNKFDLQIATIYSNLGSLYKSTNRNGYTEFILKSNQILNKLSDKIFEVKNLKVHNEKLLLT